MKKPATKFKTYTKEECREITARAILQREIAVENLRRGTVGGRQ